MWQQIAKDWCFCLIYHSSVGCSAETLSSAGPKIAWCLENSAFNVASLASYPGTEELHTVKLHVVAAFHT